MDSGFNLTVNTVSENPSYLARASLKVGNWYRGKGRNADIAFWDGQAFRTFGNKFGSYVEKIEQHWDDDGPFKPFEEL